ncbi:hypothetical protein SEMRO_363_G126960.1 [Seminavis robusta]|uniref:Uncharacterized protein n=1 Tax=Seminavis robusta TaxID=568900 RepID=A0A9N8DV10_9STRA|nr:hypothetical protein SEMRO_363_G126960.1 [Seminavis robusta]|eukprot:Sro363_g126960.1 n/a (231) ;mRNA; r:60787-61479
MQPDRNSVMEPDRNESSAFLQSEVGAGATCFTDTVKSSVMEPDRNESSAFLHDDKCFFTHLDGVDTSDSDADCPGFGGAFNTVVAESNTDEEIDQSDGDLAHDKDEGVYQPDGNSGHRQGRTCQDSHRLFGQADNASVNQNESDTITSKISAALLAGNTTKVRSLFYVSLKKFTDLAGHWAKEAGQLLQLPMESKKTLLRHLGSSCRWKGVDEMNNHIFGELLANAAVPS